MYINNLSYIYVDCIYNLSFLPPHLSEHPDGLDPAVALPARRLQPP